MSTIEAIAASIAARQAETERLADGPEITLEQVQAEAEAIRARNEQIVAERTPTRAAELIAAEIDLVGYASAARKAELLTQARKEIAARLDKRGPLSYAREEQQRRAKIIRDRGRRAVESVLLRPDPGNAEMLVTLGAVVEALRSGRVSAEAIEAFLEAP